MGKENIVPEMPNFFKETLTEAFYYNNVDEVIRLNQVWRTYLKENYNIILKG